MISPSWTSSAAATDLRLRGPPEAGDRGVTLKEIP